MFVKKPQGEENRQGCLKLVAAHSLAFRFQAAVLACGFLPGLFAAGQFPVSAERVLFQSAAIFAGTFLRPSTLSVAATGFAGGVLTAIKHAVKKSSMPDRLRSETLEGTVLSTGNGTDGKLELLVHVGSTAGKIRQKTNFTVFLKTAHEDLLPGDRIRFRASLVKTGGKGAPFYRSNLKNGELFLITRPVVSGALGKVRSRIIMLAETGPADAAAVLSAIAAGIRGRTSGKLSFALRHTGTYHLLAISGVHVASALLAGMILLRLLGAGLPAGQQGVLFYLTSAWCGGLLVVFYLAVTGISTSSSRAAFFAVIFLVAPVIGRETSLTNNIAVAFVVISSLSGRPQPDLSLCLSVAACLGIASSVRKGDSFIFGSLRVSMGAFLGTLPLITVIFRGIPVLGPVINTITIVPFAFVLIPLAVVGDFFAVVSPAISGWIFTVWKIIATPVLIFIEKAAVMPWVWLPLNPSGSVLASSGAVVSVFLWLRWKGSLRRCAVLVLIPVILGAAGNEIERSRLRHGILVTFPGIGQSDAAIIQTGGKTVLVDTGRPDPGTGTPVIARYLERRGINKIDVLFLTHNHPDHMGGAVFLLRNYPVRRLVLPQTRGGLGLWQNVLKWCSSGTRVSFVKRGDRIVEGEIKFRIFWPGEGLIADRNDLNRTSLSTGMSWRHFHVLFTGDSPWEKVISEWEEFGSLDVLKVPHHGSANGFGRFSGEGFSRKMPALSLAVCTARKPGTSSLPSMTVVKWFERRGIPFRTTGIGDGISIFSSTNKSGLPGFW